MAEAISDDETPNRFNGERTLESAMQRVKAFYQNYDKNSINSLYGDELDSFKREGKIIEMLVKKYDLRNLQEELMR